MKWNKFIFISLICISYCISLNLRNKGDRLNPEDVKSPGDFYNKAPEAQHIIKPLYAEPKIAAHVKLSGPAYIDKMETIPYSTDKGKGYLQVNTHDIGMIQKEQNILMSIKDNKVLPPVDESKEELKYFGYDTEGYHINEEQNKEKKEEQSFINVNPQMGITVDKIQNPQQTTFKLINPQPNIDIPKNQFGTQLFPLGDIRVINQQEIMNGSTENKIIPQQTQQPLIQQNSQNIQQNSQSIQSPIQQINQEQNLINNQQNIQATPIQQQSALNQKEENVQQIINQQQNNEQKKNQTESQQNKSENIPQNNSQQIIQENKTQGQNPQLNQILSSDPQQNSSKGFEIIQSNNGQQNIQIVQNNQNQGNNVQNQLAADAAIAGTMLGI
ncbi:MAG: hypothetical protein MJ252_01550 [archaeon]|nr:hypothetical protein [archaeon]